MDGGIGHHLPFKAERIRAMRFKFLCLRMSLSENRFPLFRDML
ncbi:hypothetical protein CEV33_1598 [Brucella grignonensis]|uniref:Uncharacterized protein n=1 Tax=Brucella grignonensis TaxID=94627 RepID=A0A256FB34_9HYPH|nr:hypothetical protein CEV33_1598 [Brucella grignonensis]